MQQDWNIRHIIDNESMVVHFHPIVSLKERDIVGIEALRRGVDPSGALVSPLELFDQAERNELSLELDRLCRRKALEAFVGIQSSRKLLLFVNLNSSILDAKTTGSGHFLAMTRAVGVAPERVSIEVVESRVSDPRHLKDFSVRYREAGFLIVVDDFGTEHSNLERLIQVRPDIIKVDRNIISGVDRDHYKQSVLKSICGLSEMIGALSLAEGVETIEELNVCHQLGADLFQGYLFAKPSADFGALESDTRRTIAKAVESVDTFLTRTLRRRNEENKEFEHITQSIVRSLRGSDLSDLAVKFSRFTEAYPSIECIYLLDEKGRQITETVCSQGMLKKACRHSLFQPAPRLAAHSLKNYYYYIKHLNIGRYFTDPYLSLATGNLCRTMAVVIDLPARKKCVLCIDFLDSLGDY